MDMDMDTDLGWIEVSRISSSSLNWSTKVNFW